MNIRNVLLIVNTILPLIFIINCNPNITPLSKNQVFKDTIIISENKSTPKYYSIPLSNGEEGQFTLTFTQGSGTLSYHLSLDGSEAELPEPSTEVGNLFNPINNKLTITSEETKNCQNDYCKLFIIIYSKDSYYYNSNNYEIIFNMYYHRMEQSYTKVLLNEHISGSLENLITEGKGYFADFFQADIPEDTRYVVFEFVSKSCLIEITNKNEAPSQNPIWRSTSSSSRIVIPHNSNEGNAYNFAISANSHSEIVFSQYLFKIITYNDEINDTNEIIYINDYYGGYCDKHSDNLTKCLFSFQISKLTYGDKFPQIAFAMFSDNDKEQNDYNVYVNIISGSDIYAENIPTESSHFWNNKAQINKEYFIIDSSHFEENVKEEIIATVIISVINKEGSNFRLIPNFDWNYDSNTKHILSNTPNLYITTESISFPQNNNKDDIYQINIDLFSESQIAVILDFKNETTTQLMNRKNHFSHLTILNKKDKYIHNIKILYKKGEPAIFTIANRYHSKDNLEYVKYSSSHHFLSIENQLPSYFYIPINTQINSDFTFNIKLLELEPTTESDSRSKLLHRIQLQLKGVITNKSMLEQKLKDPSIPMATMKETDGQYDTSLRHGFVYFSKEYILQAGQILNDQLYIFVTIENKDQNIQNIQRTIKKILYRVNFVPTQNYINNGNFYSIPVSQYIFTNLEQKSREENSISNSFLLKKQRINDKYIKIEYAYDQVSDNIINFAVVLNDNSYMYIKDERLLTNSTEVKILNTCCDCNGKNIIIIELPSGENENKIQSDIIFTLFMKFNYDLVTLPLQTILFKYVTSFSNALFEDISPLKRNVDSIDIRNKNIILTTNPIINKNNQFLSGEYIIRFFSKNTMLKDSNINSIYTRNYPILSYQIKYTNNETDGNSITLKDNFDVEGSIYVSIIATIKNAEEEDEIVLYETFEYGKSDVHIPSWMTVCVVFLVIALIITVLYLYRTVRRYQDKLFGKVNQLDRDMATPPESKYGPLV